MKTIGSCQFPETSEEAKLWKPKIRIHALAAHVLCVATTRIEGKWKAYCDVVPGVNHDNEWRTVLDQGCPLSRSIAIVIFREFSDIPYQT